MDNSAVASVFYEIADLLELQSVPFKPQAYRRAAQYIEQMDVSLSDVMKDGNLEELPGIGKAMAKKIEELLENGSLEYLRKLKDEIPPGLLDLMRVPYIGPKTAMLLNRELGVADLTQLKDAVRDHKLAGLKGLGEKAEERILQGIALIEASSGRTLLGEALPIAEAYMAHLRAGNIIPKMDYAGSLRRGKETVGDIDILVGTDDPSQVTASFTSYPLVEDVLSSGPTKSSVRLIGGMQVDLRVVPPDSYGAALQYFTGSKEHNVAMRRIGVEKGLKLNEYGVFERDGERRIAGVTEEDVYGSLGFPFIPPELREDTGEIHAASANELPELLSAAQIKGDLHIHTEWSDGSNTIEEVVDSAMSRGYEYIAITDHSQSLKIANGLSPERLRDQIREIHNIYDRVGDRIRVLAGSEVDIKADGSLDFPESLLSELDVVIASVHSRFKMDRNEMTSRVVTAIESGMVDILGHPTGRLIGQRASYDLDMNSVFEAAAKNGVCLEVNSFPDRLDLRDVDCRSAKNHGARVAIGTDSHSLEHMDFIRLGVITARRGWLEADDVLNASSLSEVIRTLGGRR